MILLAFCICLSHAYLRRGSSVAHAAAVNYTEGELFHQNGYIVNYTAVRAAAVDGCGSVCNATNTNGTPGKYFDFVSKAVDCNAIFSNPAVDASSKVWPPPREVPKTLEEDYTMGGRVPVKSWYWSEKQADGALVI